MKAHKSGGVWVTTFEDVEEFVIKYQPSSSNRPPDYQRKPRRKGVQTQNKPAEDYPTDIWDIAVAMGCSTTTVYTIIGTAMEKLSAQLREEYGEDVTMNDFM